MIRLLLVIPVTLARTKAIAKTAAVETTVAMRRREEAAMSAGGSAGDAAAPAAHEAAADRRLSAVIEKIEATATAIEAAVKAHLVPREAAGAAVTAARRDPSPVDRQNLARSRSGNEAFRPQ